MSRHNAHPYSIRFQFLKVIILSALPFFIVSSATALVFYSISTRHIEEDIRESTDTLYKTIEIQLDNSVRVYLRSKVEAGRNLVQEFLQEDGANPDEIMETLLSLKVGINGYCYAIDSDGRVIFHPDAQIVDTLQTGKAPVDQQIQVRQGYLEYMWQNTDELEPRRKALYMTYIPELDWILTATSYRREFVEMIDREALRDLVKSGQIATGSYSYVVNREGEQIAHPYLSGNDARGLVSVADYQDIITKMFTTRDGYTTYLWRDTPADARREKIVYLRYLPDFDWVVGTAVYRSNIARPALLLVLINMLFAFAIAALLSVSIYRINRDIERQLQQLTIGMDRAREGDLSIRLEAGKTLELIRISESFNYFIESLQRRTAELHSLNDTLENRVLERTAELSRTSEQLIEAEKMALTSRLVAGVAHEINTPTGVAMTAATYHERLLTDLSRLYEAEELSKSDLERYMSKSRESVETVIRNLKRAGELISSFKSVSSDQITLAKREIELKEVVDDTLLSLHPELKKKDIRVTVQIPRIKIDSYPGIFVHLLVNLVTNTLHHGFVDRDEGTIDISAEESQGEIFFYYQDNGLGMSRETMEHIFDPFYTTRRADGNIGLGLNIVKNMISDKLGGSINVESREGEYTRFTVRFRAQVPARLT